jgi:Ca-activated chloride channel family protein
MYHRPSHLLSLIGLLLLARVAGGQDPPPKSDVVTFDTNLVVLNVTVTDGRGNYVSGLTAKDFNVREDRSAQRIVSFSRDELPFAAVILLDTSGSMERKMTLARAACARFVDGIREGDVFAIYGFGGTKVKKMQDFSEVRDIADSVWDAETDGQTPLYDGIVAASEALAGRAERRRAIVLISDGADTRSRATLDDALRAAIGAEVALYAVDLSEAALGRSVARDNGAEVMRMLAAKTGGRFYRTPGGSQLRDAFTQTVDELRHQYTIAYEPTNERADGRWRAIEVGVAGGEARTRQGYFARKVR